MSIYSERGVSYEKGTKRATSWVRLRTETAGRKKKRRSLEGDTWSTLQSKKHRGRNRLLSNERQLETLISKNGEASEQMICAISEWAMWRRGEDDGG